jgi:hypothetical protein
VDLAPFEPYFDRSKRAIVAMFIATTPDARDNLDIGTGTLALIGGREFVLTAGHNVWNRDADRRYAIGIGRSPEGIILLTRPGDGSAGRIHYPPPRPGHDPEPDVAVVELTEKTLLAGDREPFGEDDIRFFDTNVLDDRGFGRDVIVTGFPAYLVEQAAGLALRGGTGTRLELAVPLLSMKVGSIPAVNKAPFGSKEPPEGRGVHVYLNRTMLDAAQAEVAFKQAHGMSGGPALSPEGSGVLVGLMRSVLDYLTGWDAWYEPAAEAVRLLVTHEDPAVAAAATRICERYDHDRSTARRIDPNANPNDVCWAET